MSRWNQGYVSQACIYKVTVLAAHKRCRRGKHSAELSFVLIADLGSAPSTLDVFDMPVEHGQGLAVRAV